jgi:hypothetical protein
MTTNDAIAQMIFDAMTEYCADRNSRTPLPLTKFAFTIARAAKTELIESLDYSLPTMPNTFSDEYYLSDSTFDDITNPMNILTDISSLFDILLESDPDISLAQLLADDCEYLLSIDFDDLTFNSLDELTAHIKTEYKIAPTR